MPHSSDRILPRNRSLTVAGNGATSGLRGWLRQLAQALGMTAQASGRTPPPRRPAPRAAPQRSAFLRPQGSSAPCPSLREQTEMTQLKAENRRLRSQLDALLALKEGKAQDATTQGAPSTKADEVNPQR